MLPEADFYDEYVTQRQGDLQEYRIRQIVSLIDSDTERLLDIGCGPGTLLSIIKPRLPGAKLVGIDIARSTPDTLAALGLEGYSTNAGGPLPFGDDTFDCIVCGEVIEHVVDVDQLVSEAYRVLKPAGCFVITTPNLAYIPNRVLLALGIQPLFSETSLHHNLGRHFRLLGQGGRTQGHLKIFTLSALLELLARDGFKTVKVLGYPFFQHGLLSVVDKLLTVKPSFAAGFIVKSRK